MKPRLNSVRLRCDVGRRLDRVGAEQLSRASQQHANLVELPLQRRFNHVVTLPRSGSPPQFTYSTVFSYPTITSVPVHVVAGGSAEDSELPVSTPTVRLAGGDLRSKDGAPAPPESDPGVFDDSGLQLSD